MIVFPKFPIDYVMDRLFIYLFIHSFIHSSITEGYTEEKLFTRWDKHFSH